MASLKSRIFAFLLDYLLIFLYGVFVVVPFQSYLDHGSDHCFQIHL